MKTGFGALTEALERSKNQGTGGYLNYFVWRDDRSTKGELFEKTVRFLTDEVVPCSIYEYIPCKDGKKRDFIVPASVGIDGPDTVQESGVRIPQYNNTSNLIVPKPREMTLGLAVLRQESSQMVDGRRVLVYGDREEEYKYEKDGKTISGTRPVYGVVKQSNPNFWASLAGYWARYSTIIDRDYNITRSGNDQTTTYTIIPCDPIEELRDKEALDERYSPPVSLKDFVQDLASVERARKFLLGEGLGEKKENTSPPQSAPETPQGNVAPSSDTEFASMRNDLLGY